MATRRWREPPPELKTDIVTIAHPDAIRNIGGSRKRLMPGFGIDTRPDREVRPVIFGNEMTVREPVVTLDDAAGQGGQSMTTHRQSGEERLQPRNPDRGLPPGCTAGAVKETPISDKPVPRDAGPDRRLWPYQAKAAWRPAIRAANRRNA